MYAVLTALGVLMLLAGLMRHRGRRDGRNEQRVEQQRDYIESVNEGKRVQDRVVFDDDYRKRVRDKYDKS